MRRAEPALSALAALLLSLAARVDEPQSPKEPQNFLVVVLDDVGTERLAAFGAREGAARTPHLDRLAARGVSFTAAWGMPLCSPTRAALQTGRMGFRTGIGTIVKVRQPDWALQLEEVTLPEMLARAQPPYASAAFGKWHLGNDSVGGWDAPRLAGYAHFTGAVLRGEDTYFRWPGIAEGGRVEREGYLTRATAEDALAWIADAGEPWLCYVALHAPHTPLHRPPADMCSLTEDAPASELDLYLAMLEAADHALGMLLAGLGDAAERTTVVVLGDNGSLGRMLPGCWEGRGKGSLYEGGVHVPLVVSGPSVARPGTRSAALVHAADVFPTVAELAGVNLERAFPGLAIDGVSLVPYLADPDRPSLRSTLYTELFSPNGLGPHDEYQRAVRGQRLKLIRYEGGREQLFDLADDPCEARPLVALPEDDPRRAEYDGLVAALDELEAKAR